MSTGYTIYAFGNVDTLSELFNGVAAIMGSANYLGAVAMVLILGFMGALISMAFLKHHHGVQWLLAVLLINGVLLVPKSTIQIVDETAGQPPVVVDNVPWGIAALASVVTSVSYDVTSLFETATETVPPALGGSLPATQPADLSYERTGMMFGASLIRDSMHVQFDTYFNADLVNFIDNCTIYDISQGFINANDFTRSTDLWPLMKNTNPARFTTLHDAATGAIDSHTCVDAYNLLDAEMPAETSQALVNLAIRTSRALRSTAGTDTTPALNDSSVMSAAGAVVGNQLVESYQRAMIAGAVTDVSQLVRQNALVDAFQGAGALFGQQSNDPASIMLGLAQSQTTAAMNTQNIVSGQIAAETLPLLHNGIQSVLYYAFPLVVLMALVLGGMGAVQAFKYYGLSLAWLAMWPPLYAVVNYLHSTAAAKAIAQQGFYNGMQGVSIATAPVIYSTAVSELSTTSWLLVSVPVIASAIVFGMDRIANVGIGYMSNASSSANFGSRQASDYTGNVSMDQQSLGPNRTSAFMEQDTNALGTATKDLVTGSYRYTENLGRSAVSLGTSKEISGRLSTASADAERIAQQESVAAQKSETATFSDMLNYAHQHGVSGIYGEDWRHGHDATVATRMDRMEKISNQLRHDLGIANSEQAERALALAVSVGVPGALKFLEPVSGKVSYAGRQVSSQQIRSAVSKAVQAAHEAGITDSRSLSDSFVHSQGFQKHFQDGDSRARQIQSSYQDALAHTERAQNSHEQASEYRRSAERVMAMATRGEVNWTPEFNNYVRRYALNNPGPHGIRDMGELTGNKATYWLNKFFSEGEMGRAMDGSAVWMERAGFGPAPMAADSNADLGGRYATMAPPTLDGQAITGDRIKSSYEQGERGVPGVPGDRNSKADAHAVQDEVRSVDADSGKAAQHFRVDMFEGKEHLEQEYNDKANGASISNEYLGGGKTVDELKKSTKTRDGMSGLDPGLDDQDW